MFFNLNLNLNLKVPCSKSTWVRKERLSGVGHKAFPNNCIFPALGTCLDLSGKNSFLTSHQLMWKSFFKILPHPILVDMLVPSLCHYLLLPTPLFIPTLHPVFLLSPVFHPEVFVVLITRGSWICWVLMVRNCTIWQPSFFLRNLPVADIGQQTEKSTHLKAQFKLFLQNYKNLNYVYPEMNYSDNTNFK